jgi:L-threonylcarbamoyladenylate synthase
MSESLPSDREVQHAAQALHRGELVAFATETVYGLGADADQDAAVERIYQLKGRPSHHPLIVHISSQAGVAHYAQNIPDFAHALMHAFWPGALTLILEKRPGVAMAATAQERTIGLRWPSHPVALALLDAARLLGVQGVAAPSANRFGRVSPTRAAHVREEFGDELCVLGHAECDIGIESTIIDCTRGSPILLRPGLIDQRALEDALKGRLWHQSQLKSFAQGGEATGETTELIPNPLLRSPPKASGTLASHYAPRARLKLMSAPQILACLKEALERAPMTALQGEGFTRPAHTALWARSPQVLAHPLPNGMIQRPMPQDAKHSAYWLFAVLREWDALGVEEIWVETPPQDASWAGVADRLGRASQTETRTSD